MLLMVRKKGLFSSSCLLLSMSFTFCVQKRRRGEADAAVQIGTAEILPRVAYCHRIGNLRAGQPNGVRAEKLRSGVMEFPVTSRKLEAFRVSTQGQFTAGLRKSHCDCTVLISNGGNLRGTTYGRTVVDHIQCQQAKPPSGGQLVGGMDVVAFSAVGKHHQPRIGFRMSNLTLSGPDDRPASRKFRIIHRQLHKQKWQLSL